MIAGRLETHHIWFARCYIVCDLLVGETSAFFRVFAVYAGSLLGSFLSGSDIGQFVFCQKAWVGDAFFYEFFGKAPVYLSSLALEIRAIAAFFAIQKSSLVKVYTEEIDVYKRQIQDRPSCQNAPNT